MASKHLPEEAGVLLERAINQEPKKPPHYFPMHEGRYIIIKKDAKVESMTFTKSEMDWYCEKNDKKLHGRKKPGRPKKKALDINNGEEEQIDIEKKPKKKRKRGRPRKKPYVELKVNDKEIRIEKEVKKKNIRGRPRKKALDLKDL